jgi:GPH family glycoside/pentoside/hexuronide:cation symporter
LAPDIVTYIEKKEGIRIEGLAASANSFGCKIGSGLGSAVVLWTISACGYISGAETQNDACLTAFTTLYWWVPTGLTVILLILSLLWNIQSKTINMPKGNDGKEASAVAEPQKQ